MITSETPYKLAEIIRETWPGLYRFANMNRESINKQNTEDTNGFKSDSGGVK
jgi:hypothetical protein